MLLLLFHFSLGKKNSLNKRSHDYVNRRKNGVGKLTGDKKIEKEGAAEKAAAKVKEVAEDVKDAIEGTIDGVKNIINKDKK